MSADGKRVYVVGTADTKGAELQYVKALIEATGTRAVLVDVGTRPSNVAAGVTARDVAALHPQGEHHVLACNDRGRAIEAMGQAFARFISAEAMLPACQVGRERRHLDRDDGLATPRGRRSQDHGFDARGGRRKGIRRCERYHHDVFGDRCCRPQPHQPRCARQCGSCDGRYGAESNSWRADEARDRTHDVRRHDAVRDASGAATQ